VPGTGDPAPSGPDLGAAGSGAAGAGASGPGAGGSDAGVGADRQTARAGDLTGAVLGTLVADERAGSDPSAASSAVAAPGSAAPVSDTLDLGTPSETGTEAFLPSTTSGRRRWRRRPREREESRRARRRRLGIPHRITFRVIGFTLVFAAVIAAAYGVVRWYATQNWYVTVKGNELVVYQGRPGGLLWFQPKIVDRTGITTNQILPIRLPAVRADVEEPSLAAARRYVKNLNGEYLAQQQLNAPPTTVPNTTTTTTTAPPPSTTTTAAGIGATTRTGAVTTAATSTTARGVATAVVTATVLAPTVTTLDPAPRPTTAAVAQ
jgi:hypothetical protein